MDDGTDLREAHEIKDINTRTEDTKVEQLEDQIEIN